VESSLAALTFDNSFVRALPGDPLTTNERRQVRDALYSRVTPEPVRQPRTLAYSAEVAALIGLSPEVCQSPQFAQVFGGNRFTQVGRKRGDTALAWRIVADKGNTIVLQSIQIRSHRYIVLSGIDNASSG